MDLLSVGVDLAPHQAMSPHRMDIEAAPKKTHGSVIVGTSQVDQRAAIKRRMFFPTPVRGKGPASRGRLDPAGRPLTVGLDVAGRTGLQIAKRVVMEALPYLGLPAAVEALNCSLKAGLPWRSKDR